MTDAARDLVLFLRELGERERDVSELEATQPRLQQLLGAALGPPIAQKLEYASYEIEYAGLPPTTQQGLATAASQLLLTEMVGQLAALADTDPSPLASALGLTPAQTRAAFYAAYWILDSLEWQTRDRSIPAEFPPDKRQRMLDATLRSLHSFRETGEP